jgi:Na+-transporting NADH:ubiquinone oxidoreductase subunit NqrE
MNKPNNFLQAFVGLSFFVMVPMGANAGCGSLGYNQRLQTYCMVNDPDGAANRIETLIEIDSRLKREGFSNGLGILQKTARSPSYLDSEIQPTLRYESNINGGNPTGQLVLGSIVLESDDQFLKREGLVAGVDLALGNRHFLGEGSYIKYGLTGGYSQSLEYDLNIKHWNGNTCFVKNLSGGWYLDACGNVADSYKDLATSHGTGVSVSVARTFSSKPNIYHYVSVGTKRSFQESGSIDQLIVSFDTMHSIGIFAGLTLKFGEAIENQLVNRFAASAQLGFNYNNRPLFLSLNYSDFSGGYLLGYPREDSIVSSVVTYPVLKNIAITIGFTISDSNIDYYDVTTPTFGVQFSPVRF